jgi:hypothetical protein
VPVIAGCAAIDYAYRAWNGVKKHKNDNSQKSENTK